MLPESCTLIVPHQRESSGGVYVLERFAEGLTGAMEVNVAVRKGPLRPLAGVRVLRAPQLSAEELPRAEVVIGGLAQPDGERVLALPRSRGEPLFVFQGRGAGGERRVTQLLRKRPRVLAVSSFLLEQSLARGCRAELTRPGLDRSLFHAGGPCAERGPVVAMMTHGDEGKALGDGLEALARVKAAMPEVKLALFGSHEPQGEHAASAASFLGELRRAEVAEVLREASVFVCSSLEEGLGLPGIEALACGAALASTDTKGSRDYAVHERTALVSPPGDPQALAENIIRLLRDPQLRVRLCAEGAEHALATYPPWRQAATTFQATIGRLLSEPATRADAGR